MAIEYNTRLTAINCFGSNITQINYLGGIYKLVDNVNITFVEGSTRTVVSYPIGSTVSRSTAPYGAAFIGWSTSPYGTSPQKTFTASKEMTVYRVVKYDDVDISLTCYSSNSPQTKIITVDAATHATSTTLYFRGSHPTGMEAGAGQYYAELNNKGIFNRWGDDSWIDSQPYPYPVSVTFNHGSNTLYLRAELGTSDNPWYISASGKLSGKQVVG